MTEILTLVQPWGWKLYRLGQIFDERKQKASDKDFEALSVTMQGIVAQLDSAAKTDDGDNRKLVRKGDYVINSRSDRKGSGGISPLDGTVSLISLVLSPRDGIAPTFAHHLLRSAAFQEEFYRWGHGIVADLWTTRYSDMKNIRTFLPDLPTQKRIAAFLDRETARIDELIAKKERLIEILKERGIAALEELLWGEGPETKLGYHISILPGYAFASTNFSEKPDDMRLLRGANVGVGEVRWDDTVYWPTKDVIGLERFNLSAGDIVMGMDRPWISGGIRVAQVQEKDLPCLLLQRVCKIAPLLTLNGRYLKAIIESKRFIAYFEPILTGVSVPHISGDQIANFRFPFVPIEEQEQRMNRLDGVTRSTHPISRATKTSIDRLREYRAALITAAVTGQIDVDTYGKAGATSSALDQIEERAQA